MKIAILFLAACSLAHADTTSIIYMRSNENPPLLMTTVTAMSGDGKVVVGQSLIWTAATGVTPTAFSPSEDGILNYLALSFDASVRFGVIAPIGPAYYRFWSGPWGFTSDHWPFAFEPPSDNISRRTISGDGLWATGTLPSGVGAFRVHHTGTTQTLPSTGPARSAAINFDGSVVVGATYKFGSHGTAWKITPGESTDNIETKLLPQTEFDAVSSDGVYAAGFRVMEGGAYQRGIIWKIDAETDDFHPPLGSQSVSITNFISTNGSIAAGVASRPGWPRAFVRRQGERARDLRQVLQRFGATGLDYYMLTSIGGLSDDGKIISGTAQSPWYGNVGFVATLPNWTPCPADINFDGFVDDADFSIFILAYDNFVSTDGDLNINGVTDDSDFSIFAPAYDQFVCE